MAELGDRFAGSSFSADGSKILIYYTGEGPLPMVPKWWRSCSDWWRVIRGHRCLREHQRQCRVGSRGVANQKGDTHSEPSPWNTDCWS